MINFPLILNFSTFKAIVHLPKMESVVKAIGKPVSFSDATLDEDDNDLNINESNADIQPRLPNESGRKRRHSNSDRFEMANDKYS